MRSRFGCIRGNAAGDRGLVGRRGAPPARGDRAAMRILLTSNASHDPARGGSTRSNLVWLEHLAGAGHSCLVVCAALGDESHTVRNGVSIFSVKDLVRRLDTLAREIRSFQPDF